MKHVQLFEELETPNQPILSELFELYDLEIITPFFIVKKAWSAGQLAIISLVRTESDDENVDSYRLIVCTSDQTIKVFNADVHGEGMYTKRNGGLAWKIAAEKLKESGIPLAVYQEFDRHVIRTEDISKNIFPDLEQAAKDFLNEIFAENRDRIERVKVKLKSISESLEAN